MARPVKEGLDYFPVQVDFFEDPKILMIEEKFGVKGSNIAIRLLCWIYRDGYYIRWSEDMALVFAKRVGNGVTHSLVNDVVSLLIEREFFNKDLFNSKSILTSRGIQEQWLEIITMAKRKAHIKPEFNLLESIHSVVNSEETNINTELTTLKKEEITQRKVKESKEKEIKVKESKSDHAPEIKYLVGPDPVSDLQNFIESEYGILCNDLKFKYGEGFFNLAMERFSEMNLQKNWRDSQDLRQHFTNYLIKFKENGKYERTSTSEGTKGIGGINTSGQSTSFGKF